MVGQKKQKRTTLRLSAKYRYLQNDIATRSLYNTITRVRTFTPENISGTYGVRSEIAFSAPLETKRQFYITASFATDYNQNQLLSSVTEDASNYLLRRIDITPSLSLRGTIGEKFRLTALWRTTFQQVRHHTQCDNYRVTAFNSMPISM